MTATIIEKWVTHVEDDDIFIFQVWLKQTVKLWTVQLQPHGEGKNTPVGFGGTHIGLHTALGWKTRFGKGDKRFHDTYEEAREALKQRLVDNITDCKRKHDKALGLLDLFESVHYEKRD